ncbi:DsbA family protein [Nocardiopsis mangrovi]|uniref:DsbA family protein n=1 Tax=Nocardiopsis mangrovi TaxID=1179818 RepID=A0ABV9E4K4_9ACTN
MTKNLAISMALVIAAVVGIAVLAYSVDNRNAPAAGGGADPTASSSTAPEELLVRENSHYLSRADDSQVTVVEFLDFECEACRAQFPIMERLREEYDGRINLVIRYFPLPGHTNSEPAALAVEAAAEQDALEEMYIKMYETQEEWGESQDSRVDVFEGFAEELGLDMDRFRATVADPATLDRVRADFDDGRQLGVQGTPTIYVNGRQTESMPTYEALSQAIDAELEP